MFDLAGLDEILDGSGNVFYGDVGVDAVLVVEIDDVGFEALERTFYRFLYMIGTAVEAGHTSHTAGLGIGADVEAEFGGVY